MRTTKRFTPALLERFRQTGRGRGTYQNYIPWHRVGRGDPSSRGRSHLMMWQGRQIELLSDVEWVASMFSVMVPGCKDLREQFPLSLAAADHELSAYDASMTALQMPGTLQIAEELGIRHPRVNAEGVSASWVMSTDLVLTVVGPNCGNTRLVAVSCKSRGDTAGRRTRELLQIERQYWSVRGVDWLLYTPDLFEESVGLTLRNSMPWALGDPAPADARALATELANVRSGQPLLSTLLHLRETLDDAFDLAQRAFWQSVWTGLLPLDLRRGWRPHEPLCLLSNPQFLLLNPIASQRSAWN